MLAPAVAQVIESENGASKKPRSTLNFVSATTPTEPVLLFPPGVGGAKKRSGSSVT